MDSATSPGIFETFAGCVEGTDIRKEERPMCSEEEEERGRDQYIEGVLRHSLSMAAVAQKAHFECAMLMSISDVGNLGFG